MGANIGTVSNCYSAGQVNGVNVLGGLVGMNSGNVVSSFWDTITSGMDTSNGGTGLPTSQMQTLSTFGDAGWDFVGEEVNGTNDFWQLCIDGLDYPRLAWQFGAGDFVDPGRVDYYDLLVLTNDWLSENSRCCDISPAPTGDGIVNLFDYAKLSRHWLQSNP